MPNNIIMADKQSGGLVPPVNAIAQFEVQLNIETAPTNLYIDFSAVQSKMTANRTYIYTLMLLRDDVITDAELSGYSYETNAIILIGRISKTGCDVNNGQYAASYETSMTSGVQLSVASVVASKSYSNGVETIVLANTGHYRLGKWKGVFTVLPPWSDQYTGEKVTSCPSGFLTYD